ncbi:hypothetical protein CEB3_c11660 [Peptococcaceae bacterium CEB3]|nr:hypothetical protein CEB3_c11660 [Peptococcaceae bacterium CEB3]
MGGDIRTKNLGGCGKAQFTQVFEESAVPARMEW